MIWFLTILVALVFIFTMAIMAKPTEYKETVEEKSNLITDDIKCIGNMPGNFLASYSIAGINRNGCKLKHVGSFLGMLVAEPSNEFDPNAIKIVHEDGTKLGYIKTRETDDVRYLIGEGFKKYPCVGQIKFVSEDDDEFGEEIVEDVKNMSGKSGFFVGRIYIDSDHL